MELFVVRSKKSLEVLRGGFNNKMEAKTFRKSVNHAGENGEEIMEYTVSPGRNHNRTLDKGKV